MAKLLVRTDEGEWVEGYGNLRVIDGPSQNSEAVTLPNGNAVAPGAAAVLREFGVDVGGAAAPRRSEVVLDVKIGGVDPEPWVGAERELDQAQAEGRIRCWEYSSGLFAGVPCYYRVGEHGMEGAVTREEAAAKAVTYVRTLPRIPLQYNPAGMSDQAVRDELWTLGWRLDGGAWTNGHWNEWRKSNTGGVHARRALVEARRLAAEAKAGGQG